MPLFSILIPTRNRAELLKYAIQSILNQDFGDYELIVSDNDSSDDTREVVESFNDSRIHYINTERYLLSDGSWNFAYKHATGDYILLLGDDDYLISGTLRQIKDIIQKKSALMVSWGLITYYDNTYNDAFYRNTIHARSFTGKIIEVDTKEVLGAYFNLSSPSAAYPPHPSAVCISRYIADEISHKFGEFYAPPFADITAISRSLAYSDSPLYIIDKPLVIIGRTCHSFVTKFLWDINEARKEHAPSELSMVMFKGKYSYNFHTESLLRVKYGDPERFRGYDIHLERYCCLYYQNMLNVSRSGFAISADLEEFYQKFSTLPSNTQRNVRRYIRKAQQEEFVRRSPLWNIAAIRTLLNKLYYSLFRKDRAIRPIRGNSVGVYDIASCAGHLSEIAQALKQPIDVWDYQRAPTSCEYGDRFVER